MCDVQSTAESYTCRRSRGVTAGYNYGRHPVERGVNCIKNGVADGTGKVPAMLEESESIRFVVCRYHFLRQRTVEQAKRRYLTGEEGSVEATDAARRSHFICRRTFVKPSCHLNSIDVDDHHIRVDSGDDVVPYACL